MALDAIFDYFRHYDKTAFWVVACQGNEPTERDFKTFERQVGFRLPSEFRDFTLSPLGGLHMEVREELWPRPKEFEVGPFWSFLYGVSVFGIAKDIPDWLDIRVQFERFRVEEGAAGLVPFLQRVSDANRYCFTKAGQIVLWDHETPDEHEAVDGSFSSLLLREINDLEERKNRKVRGEDRRKA